MNDRLILLQYRDRFTDKELEVLQLMTRGMSQRSVALALGLSRSSVQSRIETATRRLRVVIAEEEAKRAAQALDEKRDRREERAADRGVGDGSGAGTAVPAGRGRRKQAAARDSGDRPERERSDSRDAA